MKKIWLAAGLLAALAAGCGSPAVTHYRSVFKDYSADLPTGWNVYTDGQGIDNSNFAETRFIGPFDGDALFGLPSFSVKWFRDGRTHVLRDGTTERYQNADDYISQTVSQVYGYSYGDKMSFLLNVVPDETGQFRSIIPRTQDIPALTHTLSGLPLKMFIVQSPARVGPNVRWGVVPGPDGKPYNNRKHAFAVITMPTGFYVLSYPATANSFPHDFARFSRLVTSFHPLTDGPGGPKVVLSTAAR